MRSPERIGLLIGKEWQELRAARAWWLFLAAVGLLTGHAFATAVASYAEASGAGGGPAALAQGLSPLDGFVVPVLGAYAIAASLLLPFVAIRLMAVEKESGGATLVLTSGVRPMELVFGKFIVAMLGWVISLLPAVMALGFWAASGGHLHAPELAAVLLGHLLRAAFTIALGLAAAALTESASSAAIVALAITIATWALDFVAAVHGGLAQEIARLTPEAALRVFERGELSTAVILASLIGTIALLIVAACGLGMSRRPRRALALMGLTIVGAAVALYGVQQLRGSADVSEDRRSSFAIADERALASIKEPLEIEVHLAPEDPRLADLQRSVLDKLRRSMADVRVRYVSASGTGLFAAPDERYGEVWYAIGTRREMSRSTTPPIVLETIYHVAGRSPPPPSAESAYPGYPLVMRAGWLPAIFYVVWPLLVLAAWLVSRRPPSPQSSFAL